MKLFTFSLVSRNLLIFILPNYCMILQHVIKQKIIIFPIILIIRIPSSFSVISFVIFLKEIIYCFCT